MIELLAQVLCSRYTLRSDLVGNARLIKLHQLTVFFILCPLILLIDLNPVLVLKIHVCPSAFQQSLFILQTKGFQVVFLASARYWGYFGENQSDKYFTLNTAQDISGFNMIHIIDCTRCDNAHVPKMDRALLTDNKNQVLLRIFLMVPIYRSFFKLINTV